MPIFYAFLGYHPDMPVLYPVLAYIWHALFVFLGATLAFVFKKYKYLAYLLILVVAFLCRDVISLPWLNIQKATIYSFEGGEMLVYMALEAGELTYFAYMLFVSTFISGIFGVFYSKKQPLEFIGKSNTFLFCNIFAISALYYMVSGILETYKYSGVVFAAYMTGFAVSYFIVRNFAYIDREIGVYGETGAYSVSGAKRVYPYYFSVLSFVTILPVFAGIFLIPLLINSFGSAIRFAMGKVLSALLKTKGEGQGEEAPVFDFQPIEYTIPEFRDSSDKMFVYYILVAVFFAIILTLIVVFRKKIISGIKNIILLLKSKMRLENHDAVFVINEEIITKAKKEKKAKSSYKNYLKKAKKIKDLREAFLFSYSYIFWNTIKKDEELNIGATPNELAEKYESTSGPAELYQNIKYGQKPADNREILKGMTVAAESFMQKFL